LRRSIAAAVAVLSLVVAVPATAATPAEKRLAKLERQMKTIAKLQTQVTTLQKQVKQLTSILVLNFAADACATAATADAFTSTWAAVDELGAAQVTPKTYFGPQAAIDDRKSCTDVKVARQTALPPTMSSFVGMINLLYGP
jgi:hypothetical protein